MEHLNLTVDVETITKLNKICKAMDRTASGAVRQIIKEYELNE